MKNTFKKTYLAVGFLLLTNFVLAQAPQSMTYQSVIRNSSNALVASMPVGIQLSVLQGNDPGIAVYVETQTATTNANGLLSLQIGTGSATTGTFSQIDWANGPYFIKTEIDPTGGSNYSITGTQQLASVPYALYAAKSGDATTMGAISDSPSANGGTITNGALSLAPADATNGGVVTTGAQTFAGDKIFSSDVVINGTPFGTKGTPGNIAIGTNAGQTTQGLNAVAMGTNAGVITQGQRALAMGEQAGQTTQSAQAVAIGFNAGQNNQGYGSVAIGSFAGQINQTNTSVAIGFDAGSVNQNANAVAIGYGAGSFNQNSVGVAIGNNTGHAYQGFSSVAIGNSSAQNNQSDYAIAMGYTAGQTNQGTNAIAIGNAAGTSNQAANSIILNASGVDLNNANNGLFIAPIRDAASTNVLSYDPITKEITYSTDAVGLQGPTGATGPQGPAGATGSVGSVTAIAGTSNANGATISDGNLTLTPADATNGGIVTNSAQTFAGNKTFTGTATANSFVKAGGTASQYLMANGSSSSIIRGTVAASGTVSNGTGFFIGSIIQSGIYPIAFNTPFTTIPIVVATVQGSAGISVSVSNVTTTGFRVYTSTSSTLINSTFSFIAMAP